jgi:hypothetical protein
MAEDAFSGSFGARLLSRFAGSLALAQDDKSFYFSFGHERPLRGIKCLSELQAITALQ